MKHNEEAERKFQEMEKKKREKIQQFDQKYQRKEEWYQEHIIQPQIQKRIEEYDVERKYNRLMEEQKLEQEQKKVEL